eukprot:CAMPEP_0185598608 /NCGR_PEP_ID=MMETSP0434-20130131/82117_1 /TAXON_ID=626734 ORGANISM="Favella taraikaensis, Strain Fe Narragansett Bay" /NCGR_SAMPLE_ID=MMETSP0434 /ASSEMBLY_ACC=CAM_ASM_000379 /LENGTH=90 /DNA_ID=CAMNT_0028227659 /DNA_START=219 /DNA_END=491 /DNA_ORIENTATION=-
MAPQRSLHANHDLSCAVRLVVTLIGLNIKRLVCIVILMVAVYAHDVTLPLDDGVFVLALEVPDHHVDAIAAPAVPLKVMPRDRCVSFAPF